MGLAHLATNKEQAAACAYSQKVLKMGKMLKMSGHKVFFYGVEGSTVECDEFIQVSTKTVLRETYGDYDYKSEMYKFDIHDLAYTAFNENAVREIKKRKRADDFLLVPFGFGEKAIADAVGLYLTVESGIGYTDTFAQFKVFESYAWMHYLYGRDKVADGKFYDCVIPNYFDPKDFAYRNKKEDYFLYIGRLIKRKGVKIAKETVEAIGGKLVLAGQKGTGQDFIDLSNPCMEYVGFVNFEERKELLSKAMAVFVPTTYIGPFEGVSIEAAFSGTPVITTDHG
ncbi:glycosyltransferase, partial [bacterium]|nr:glycosyltransferase [bacterium]